MKSSGMRVKRSVFVYLGILVAALVLLSMKGIFIGANRDGPVNAVKNEVAPPAGASRALSGYNNPRREGRVGESNLGSHMDEVAEDLKAKHLNRMDEGRVHEVRSDKLAIKDGDYDNLGAHKGGSSKELPAAEKREDIVSTMRPLTTRGVRGDILGQNRDSQLTAREEKGTFVMQVERKNTQNTGSYSGQQKTNFAGAGHLGVQRDSFEKLQKRLKGQEYLFPSREGQSLGQLKPPANLERNSSNNQNRDGQQLSEQRPGRISSQGSEPLSGMVFYDGSGKKVEPNDKWIVVTSINPPTKDILALSKVPGWKMVVIGDTKTPKGWRCPNVVFLDVETQKMLGLEILNHLPYKSYSRKNIGYLFALKFGAKFIYDTDDDNQPNDSLRSFDMGDGHNSNVLVVDTANLTYNPYPHFGQSTIWPRGFPLDLIMGDQPREYKLCKMLTPLVRQGVVNGDPDVDAIWRLVKKHPKRRVNVLFDRNAPRVVLPVNTFSPYNSQNTISSYDGFWGLLFPQTINMRVCDIWRSYWAQKLFWLLGYQIGFYTAGTFQFRSPHSYLKDFKDETQMYHQATDFVNFLSKWQCGSPDFFTCVKELSVAMVPKGFWGEGDAKLVEAWLNDLLKLGYKPPQIKEVKETTCVKPPSRVIFYPHEQKASFGQSTKYYIAPMADKTEMIRKFVHEMCPRPKQVNPNLKLNGFSLVNDILLIIRIKKAPTTESIGRLEAFYRPRFSQILYCGTWQEEAKSVYHHWRASFLDVGLATQPTVTCLLKAAEMHYLVSGYMVIQQESLVNIDTIQKNRNATWVMNNWISVATQQQCQSTACIHEIIHLDEVNKAVLADGRQDVYSSAYQSCALNKPGVQFSYIPNTSFYVSAHFNKELRNIADANIQSAVSVLAWLQCLSPQQTIQLSSSSIVEQANSQTDVVEYFDFNNNRALCPLLGYDA